ncbi:hypothetical protein [Pararhizobium mangrovi]|uniref:Glycosyltransferase RgtA/B/C/D-like domain-containing protein n=1 Tax=Pararhizobium mangrovi TaxID=2590452 RepID=A0A506U811_9HYPH|nr:hypothetical protein [Pararhizobium mangrovi]TPW29618.1 hypothetical protein FJU11_07205 [Pararhizobium mangrovi]
MGEYVVVSGLFLSGWSFGVLTGLSAVAAFFFSFICGLSLVVFVSAVLLWLGLPTNAFFVWAVACGLPFTLLAARPMRPEHLRPGHFRTSLITIVVGLVSLAVLVFFLRSVPLEKYHIDTFKYFRSGILFSRNETQYINLNDLEKRLFSFPIALSLARIYGEFYVKSLVPALSIGVLSVSLFFFWAISAKENVTRAARYGIAALMLLLMVSNNRYVWNSFYLNDHLYVAACVLIIAGAGVLNERMADVPRSFLVSVQILMMPALIMGRAEGFLLAGFAILPFILNPEVAPRDRRVVLAGFAVVTFAWHMYLAHAFMREGSSLPLSVFGPAALAVLAVLAVPFITITPLVRFRRAILILAETALWVALLVATIGKPGVMVESLSATYQNIVVGAGSWGRSLVVLAVIFVFVLVFCKDRRLATLRFPVTASIPMFFLLAYLRNGGAYRVGNGDSLNRMLIEIFPLAVLYLAVAAISLDWRRPFVVPDRQAISPENVSSSQTAHPA